jgi:hypothetical protein
MVKTKLYFPIRELEAVRWKLEVRSWKLKLEVGSWKLEVGSWKLEVEVGSWKLEVRSWKLEVGSWKAELRNQKAGYRIKIIDFEKNSDFSITRFNTLLPKCDFAIYASSLSI